MDEALDVVSVPESAVYDTDESEYVRRAEMDDERLWDIKRRRAECGSGTVLDSAGRVGGLGEYYDSSTSVRTRETTSN